MSKPSLTLKNPLSPEHLLLVRDIYRSLRNERKEIFGGLPFGTSWIRFRYLKKGTIRTLALTEFDKQTIAIHPLAFDYTKPIVLEGLLHHELLHLVLGKAVGHNKFYRAIEQDWERYSEWHRERGKFVRAIEENARSEGRLLRYECPNCRKVLLRTRPMKPESACSACCDSLNGGVWSESFVLVRGRSIDNGGITDGTVDEGEIGYQERNQDQNN